MAYLSTSNFKYVYSVVHLLDHLNLLVIIILVQAHLYWNTSQELGFLSNAGNWKLRSRLNNAYGA